MQLSAMLYLYYLVRLLVVLIICITLVGSFVIILTSCLCVWGTRFVGLM